jgi:hypothetical protein
MSTTPRRPAAGAWLTLAALRRSRGRTIWAVLVLALVAGLTSSLSGVNGLIRERARRELSRFGPNVMLRSGDAGLADFPRAWLPDAARLLELGVEAAVLAAPAAPDGSVVVQPLLGETLPEWARPGAEASALGLLGRVSEPAADGAVPSRVALAALRVDPRRLGASVDALSKELPGVRVDVVRAVALTESRVLDRMGAFVLAASIVLVLLCGVSFSSTLLAQWMERRAEVALMLSLGARRGTVTRLFAQELGALALVGGVAGAFAGSLVGWLVLRRGFAWDGPPWAWPWWAVVAGLVAAVLVAALGGVAPVRRALGIEAVAALGGE